MTETSAGPAPGLYLVATPIGTARDITLRALDLLASVDVIAAEDTRTARKLLDIHGIALNGRPLIAYHDHNGPKARPKILHHLAEGHSVAYMSEAGTPLIADPGYALAQAVRKEGFAVTSLPGPSAVITALTLSGLPTDRFLFAGFAPNASGARRRFLAEFAAIPATLVFYESGKRIISCLNDMTEVFGGDRPAALARELTKKFEEVRQGTLAELAEGAVATPPKGELVVLVGRPVDHDRADEMEDMLTKAIAEMGMRDAVDAVSGALNLPRRLVYQAALRLKDAHDDD